MKNFKKTIFFVTISLSGVSSLFARTEYSNEFVSWGVNDVSHAREVALSVARSDAFNKASQKCSENGYNGGAEFVSWVPYSQECNDNRDGSESYCKIAGNYKCKKYVYK